MADRNRFLRDVRDHEMTIELDQGVHRSVLFKRPRSRAYCFRLVTWPGHLAISGDCEDYTFARLPDMFEFFRDAGPAYGRDDRIDEGYWAGKLTAIGGGRSGDHSVMQLSEERFKRAVMDGFEEWEFDSPEQRAQSLAYLNDDWDGLLECHPQELREAVRAACEYECPVTGQRFTDFRDSDVSEYSYHLVWAMRAIQWGIKRYDLHKQGRTQADHDRRVLLGNRRPVPSRPYFEAETTSATIPNRGAWAVYLGDQPRRTERGISYPLRFPMLMLPDFITPQESTVKTVAEVLNQHAERFIPGESAQSTHDRRVLAGAV